MECSCIVIVLIEEKLKGLVSHCSLKIGNWTQLLCIFCQNLIQFSAKVWIDFQNANWGFICLFSIPIQIFYGRTYGWGAVRLKVIVARVGNGIDILCTQKFYGLAMILTTKCINNMKFQAWSDIDLNFERFVNRQIHFGLSDASILISTHTEFWCRHERVQLYCP